MSITRSSFDPGLWPSDVQTNIVAAALAADPFLGNLTQRVTTRSRVVVPYANPSGADFVGELADLPAISPGDDAVVIVPAKIGGQILLSNESVQDSTENITALITSAIAKSHVSRTQHDVIYGPTVPNVNAPQGFYGDLTVADGETLRAAVIAAAAAVMGNGGRPDRCFISAELWGAEAAREAAAGPVAERPLGLFGDLGLRTVVVPALAATDAIVLDSTQAYTVLRDDVRIDLSTEGGEAWTKDGVSARVLARVAVGLVEPDKHVRSITVTPA